MTKQNSYNKKNEFQYKIFRIEENFVQGKDSSWLVDNAWRVWSEYFHCFRYWLKRRELNHFTYCSLLFNNLQLQLQFNTEEFSSCFSCAMKYFINVEDYEMCQYIKNLAKSLNIEIKLD